MIPQKCQPSFNNPCLDANTIIDGGGQIQQLNDGTVSVWINDGESLIPYTDVNTKVCCEFLGYIFDTEKQKCLWTEPVGCDTCEKKIVINPENNDGVVFGVDDDTNQICSLDISFDYIFKFDCSVLNGSETINVEAQTIINQINDLTDELNSIDCTPLSGLCEEYTEIYENMCYPIEISTFNIIDSYIEYQEDKSSVIDKLPSNYKTICCLTDAGLERWRSILGDIKYDLWLTKNGCDTTIYTNKQILELYNEGVQLALTNGTNINPYFLETDNGICDKQLAYENKVEACKEYEDCLSRIEELEGEISDLESQLEELEGVLCDDPIKNIERFGVTLTLDAETDTPSLYETIYEEQFFNIGEDNLMQYIVDSLGNTGIQILSDGEILPGFINDDCDSNEICKSYRDAFIKELYLTQYLPEFGEPENSLENEELLTLMGGWYNSSWLKFNTLIANQEIIEQIANRKIRISLKINNCCFDFGILLDNVSIIKNCDTTTTTLTKIVNKPKFDLTKIIDNKKSWVSVEEFENREFIFDLRDTSYSVNHHKLVINTKEIDLNVDPARAIENDVFNYLLENDCALECTSGSTSISQNLNIDFESILNSQIPTGFTSCEISVMWGVNVFIDNEIVYNNIFYSGETATPIPSIMDYTNELINISNELGVLFTINGDEGIFTNIYDCDNLNYLNSSFKLDLTLDITTCEYKLFEDNECFTFEDGEPFYFEDN
jgi:hypothetical protein